MTSFIEKLYSFITDKELIQKNDSVCVGISGGADSVCLLQLLYELSERLGITLCAFHVNHNLRGSESDADQAFVVQFCDSRGIPLSVYDFDIAALALENKKSIEETGRIMRKKAALDCMEKYGADKTALAHHLNDSAETLLFNLARGTSLSGLKGIAPRSGNIIRPLLIFSRGEIEDELRARKISWRTDSTNLKDEYSRNKLRLNILPYFEKNINAGSIRHIAAAARDIEEADGIINDLALKISKKIVSENDGCILIDEAVAHERELVGGYIIMNALKTLTGNVTDIKRLHIDKIRRLIYARTGKAIDIPYGITAERVYKGIRLFRKNKAWNTPEEKDIKSAVRLVINGDTQMGDAVFRTRVFDVNEAEEEIPKKKYTKWFDYDKLTDNLELRCRRSGDYLVIDREGHTKKLKRYFTDMKIPKEERDGIICLADGDKVIWAVGWRIGEDCKIERTTSRIIEISYLKKSDHLL